MNDETAISTQVKPQANELADLRAMAMSVPKETMLAGLAQHIDKRKAFRTWLKEQMTEGVHYGVPPGCEPMAETKNGIKGLNIRARGGEFKWYPESQWTPKSSLYQAGADFIIELMGLLPKFEADEIGWKQLGSVAGQFVYKCILFSKSNNEEVGEGLGARKAGQKGGDENNAIKMCCKCAKVAAVINAYGLSDLFTQDMEDMPTPNPNPAENKDTPNVGTREERKQTSTQAAPVVSMDELKELSTRWVSDKGTGDKVIDKADYASWARGIIGGGFDATKTGAHWTRERLNKLRKALGMKQDGEA